MKNSTLRFHEMRKQRVKLVYFFAMVLAISTFYFGDIVRTGKASKKPFFVMSDALIPPDIPLKHNSPITLGL